eukprot:4481421-Prymnesium_polylepis.1
MLKSSLQGNCMTRLLACVNPGQHQFNETRNVLMYVLRATRVVDEEEEKKDIDDDDEERGEDKEEKRQEVDPMEGDEFDKDEVRAAPTGSKHMGKILGRTDPLHDDK